MNQRLQRAIRAVPDLRGASSIHVLQCSSPHATGAIILHVWADSETHPRIVIFTPRDPSANRSLENEWSYLSGLHESGTLQSFMPPPSSRFEVDGARFYAYSGIPGWTMLSRYRNRLLMPRQTMLDRFGKQALGVALALHRNSTRHVPGRWLADDLRNDLAILRSLVPGLPEQIAVRGEAAASHLANAPFEFAVGRIHGDFSPYNCITTGFGDDDKVGLVDWEHTQAERPQHLDIYRFISACTLMGWQSQNARSALAAMSRRENPLVEVLLSSWLDVMSPGARDRWLSEPWFDTLWWHYWVHAALREQERCRDSSDFRDGAYVNGILQLSK